MDHIAEISTKMQRGKGKEVCALIEQALAEGVPARKILDEGLLAGMSVIGDLFKRDEVFIPEVLVAARAMNAGAQILKPHLAASGVVAKGRVCIGTVQGDLHDIGKQFYQHPSLSDQLHYYPFDLLEVQQHYLMQESEYLDTFP